MEGYEKIGHVSDRVIEECSELIKAICKARRFGLYDFHPKRPESNNQIEILTEIKDVERVIAEYRTELEKDAPKAEAGQ